MYFYTRGESLITEAYEIFVETIGFHRISMKTIGFLEKVYEISGE